MWKTIYLILTRKLRLDAASFQQMFDKWGPAEYSGLIGQVKSNNEDNLVYKDRTEKMFITNDMEKK